MKRRDVLKTSLLALLPFDIKPERKRIIVQGESLRCWFSSDSGSHCGEPLLVKAGDRLSFGTCGWWKGSMYLEYSFNDCEWIPIEPCWVGNYDTNISYTVDPDIRDRYYRVVFVGLFKGPSPENYPGRWKLETYER